MSELPSVLGYTLYKVLHISRKLDLLPLRSSVKHLIYCHSFYFTNALQSILYFNLLSKLKASCLRHLSSPRNRFGGSAMLGRCPFSSWLCHMCLSPSCTLIEEDDFPRQRRTRIYRESSSSAGISTTCVVGCLTQLCLSMEISFLCLQPPCTILHAWQTL